MQDLPKGGLLVVAGHDALGNPSALDESDLEVTFHPPEAVHDAAIKVLPDTTVVICGQVQHEAEAFVSVLGSKVRVPGSLSCVLRLSAPFCGETSSFDVAPAVGGRLVLICMCGSLAVG